MPPKGKCRVCGDPAPGNMPCYVCAGALLDRDNVNLSDATRTKAAAELVERGRKK